MDWRDIPSLAALRAFEAAARCESYSAAARELNVTHAAVAQHVRALETHFGTGLITREGRQMRPTQEGRRLAEDLARGFAEIASGVRALARQRGEGPVRVTVTRSFAENWLMPRLGRFWSAHPDIPLSIAADDRVLDLRRDGFDLAIRYGRGTWPGLDATFLTTAEPVVVAAPAIASMLEYDPDEEIPIADLADQNWLIDTSYSEYLRWLESDGLPRDALRANDLSSNSLVLAACRAGAGVSVQARGVVERDIETGALVVLRSGCDPGSGYYLAHVPGTLTPGAQVFSRWLSRSV